MVTRNNGMQAPSLQDGFTSVILFAVDVFHVK